jgi:hypothetical protein
LVASAVGIGGELFTIAIALVNTLVFAAHLLGCSTRSADLGSVAEVAVDTNEVGGHTVSLYVLDDDVAGALCLVVGAVAA